MASKTNFEKLIAIILCTVILVPFCALDADATQINPPHDDGTGLDEAANDGIWTTDGSWIIRNEHVYQNYSKNGVNKTKILCNGNLELQSDGYLELHGLTLEVKGNVLIYSYGTLIAENCTILINTTRTACIEIKAAGKLSVHNSNLKPISGKYIVRVEQYGRLNFENSTLLGGGFYTNTPTVFVMSDDVVIYNSTFSENCYALSTYEVREKAIIANNRFINNFAAISMWRSTLRFEHNFINECKHGVVAYSDSKPAVVGNVFEKVWTGIEFESSKGVIANNTILNSKVGIQLKYSTPEIVRNRLFYNEIAIFCAERASPVIQNNTIGMNHIGITSAVGSQPLISFNDIYSSDEYAIENFDHRYLLTATNNWFGTALQRVGGKVAVLQSSPSNITGVVQPYINPLDKNYKAVHTIDLQGRTQTTNYNISVEPGGELTIKNGMLCFASENYWLRVKYGGVLKIINCTLISLSSRPFNGVWLYGNATFESTDIVCSKLVHAHAWSSITFLNTNISAEEQGLLIFGPVGSINIQRTTFAAEIGLQIYNASNIVIKYCSFWQYKNYFHTTGVAGKFVEDLQIISSKFKNWNVSIDLSGAKNIVIKHCIFEIPFSTYAVGIALQSGGKVWIDSNGFTQSITGTTTYNYGIDAQYLSDLVIANNTMMWLGTAVLVRSCTQGVVFNNYLHNGQVGLYFIQSTNFHLRDNTLQSFSKTAIELDRSSDNRLENTMIVSTYTATGILLTYSNRNAFFETTISGVHDGVRFENSSFNKLIGSDIRRNMGTGIYVYGGRANNITDNTVYNNYKGICISNTDDVLIVRATISSTAANGMEFVGYTGRICDCNIYNSASVGIKMSSTNLIIENCNITDNKQALYFDLNSRVSIVVSKTAVLQNNAVSITDTLDVKKDGYLSVKNVPEFDVKNIFIEGAARIDNAIFKINATEQAVVAINSTANVVISNSTFNSKTQHNFEFWIFENAVVNIENSVFNSIGGNDWSDNYMHLGMWLNSDFVKIRNSAITNNYVGLVCSNAKPEITNNLIASNFYGIYVTNQASPTIADNKILHNDVTGIYIERASATLINNEFWSNTNYGLYCQDSFESYWLIDKPTSIKNNAILFRGNIFVKNTNLSVSAAQLKANLIVCEAANLTLVNSTLESYTTYVGRFRKTTLTTLNCKVDSTKFLLTESVVIEQVYFNLLVLSTDKTPIRNVDVKLISKDGVASHYTTDAAGRVAWQIITFCETYDTFKIWRTPHTITVSHRGATKSMEIYLDKSYLYDEPFIMTLNHKPSVLKVTIQPAQSKINDLLTVEIEGWSDLDNDSAHYFYRWQRWQNDAWHDIGEYNATLFLDYRFAKHDSIRVVVTPYDGYEEGTPKYSNVVEIQNSPPCITSIRIEPLHPKEGDTIRVVVEAADPDNDEIYYQYDWYKNGKIVAGALSERLTSDLFDKNDTIYCVVTPFDAEGRGAAQVSGCVVVENTPPQLMDDCVIDLGNNTFLFTIRYKDADNDAPVKICLSIDGRTYNLAKLGNSTNYAAEVLFGAKIVLPGGEHIYKYIASDGDGIPVETVEKLISVPALKVIAVKKGIDWFPLIITAVIFLIGVFIAWLVFTKELIFNLRESMELEKKLRKEIAREKEVVETERALMETEEKIAELIVKEEEKVKELKEELGAIEREVEQKKEDEFPTEE